MSAHILEVSANSEWQSGVKTLSQVRDFTPIIMDEPLALGGQDQGPNPLEYLIASLNGCKGVMIPLVAKELGFEFSELSFKTNGKIDLRGLMGEPGISTHFQTLTFCVTIKTNESNEHLQALKNAVASRCPVYNLLRDAKVDLHTEWTQI